MEHRLFVPGVCVKTVITEDRTSCGSIKEYCSIYRHTNLGREALKSKNALFPWYTIVEVGEAYTSKTCEECGTLHQKLGGNKVFKCPKCNHTADRDLHAAKNILLRYITREKLLSEGWD